MVIVMVMHYFHSVLEHGLPPGLNLNHNTYSTFPRIHVRRESMARSTEEDFNFARAYCMYYNKICVTYFLSTKKNYITFGSKYQNLLSVEKQGMLFVWVLNFLCLLVFESMKNPLRCASHPNFPDLCPIFA